MNVPFKVDLEGKVAVVTGGSGVLCSEFAKALAYCGAKVAVMGRTKEKCDKVVEEIRGFGGTAITVCADVLNKDEMISARQLIHKELGTCDILINGAGGNHPKGTTTREHLFKEDLEAIEGVRTFFDLNPIDVEYVFSLNFTGTLIPAQVFSRDMVGKNDAVIINISSMNAFMPLTKIPAYSGAKAAVSNFTQWLAVHFSKVGIRVNAIAPGFFLSEQNRALLINPDGSYTERANKIINHTPMGRFGQNHELLGTLLFLVDSKAAGFVNGVVIPVDGGFSAYSGV
ncbi:MAG: SDR family oxidoreductase [Clostridia bacterium]|nr:SDR family oxidoreductase [Clostridia bacterium]